MCSGNLPKLIQPETWADNIIYTNFLKSFKLLGPGQSPKGK
jgi:hypothetical protein